MARVLPGTREHSLRRRTVRSHTPIPTRVPLPPTQDGLQDRDVPPQQYHLTYPVYPTGEVCISILHPPVEDPLNPQEKLSEKWNPILTMEAVLISVTSMLVDPNLESPANVDAAKLMKENRKEYDRKLRYLARKSIGDV